MGSGNVGKHIRQGQALRERRETLPDSTVKERSQRSFSSRLGISQAFLSRLENGHEPISGYGLEWFERYAPFYKWTVDEMLSALGIEYAKSTRTVLDSEQYKQVGFISSAENWLLLPIRDIAAAGNGLPVSEDSYDFGMVAVPKTVARPGIEAVRVTGDSMTVGNTDTDIRDGDAVLVDTRDTTPRDGKVYVVQLPSIGAVVKRVRLYGEPFTGAWLVSDNNRYPPFVADEAVVIGRVFDVIPKRRGV